MQIYLTISYFINSSYFKLGFLSLFRINSPKFNDMLVMFSITKYPVIPCLLLSLFSMESSFSDYIAISLFRKEEPESKEKCFTFFCLSILREGKRRVGIEENLTGDMQKFDDTIISQGLLDGWPFVQSPHHWWWSWVVSSELGFLLTSPHFNLEGILGAQDQCSLHHLISHWVIIRVNVWDSFFQECMN